MKYGIILAVLLLLLSCKITDDGSSGNGTGSYFAEIVLTNKVDHTITVAIHDGTSSGITYSLASNESFQKSWRDYEPVFTEQDGVVTITYSSEIIPERELNIVLELGTTIYQDIYPYESSFTFYNNTLSSIDLSLNDGSSSSNFPQTIQPSASYVKTWDASDPFYTIQQGILHFSYVNQQGEQIDEQRYIPQGTHLYHQVDEAEYMLKIINATNSDAWYTLEGVDYPPLEPDEYDMFYSQDISGFSQKQIEYSGYHIFTKTDYLDLSSFVSTDFFLEPDAGAISIKNQSAWRIDEVYITETNNQSWGNNVLSGFLYENVAATWTVTEGYWDMKIIDENQIEYQARDFFVTFDSTKQFFFPDDFPEIKWADKTGIPTESAVEFKGILRK